ncbi:MAG: hypothetical protein ACK4GE_05805 [Caldimicrobium sp.]
MVYFIRARMHYQYGKDLLEGLLGKKRELTFALLRDIYLQGLKALYALSEVRQKERSPSPEEMLAKVLPSLNEEEKRKVLQLKEIFLSYKEGKREPPNLRDLLEEVKDFIRMVEKCLQPIL